MKNFFSNKSMMYQFKNFLKSSNISKLYNFKVLKSIINNKGKIKCYRFIDIQKKLSRKNKINKIICFGKIIGPVDSNLLKPTFIVSQSITKKVENALINSGGNFVDLNYFIKNNLKFHNYIFLESLK